MKTPREIMRLSALQLRLRDAPTYVQYTADKIERFEERIAEIGGGPTLTSKDLTACKPKWGLEQFAFDINNDLCFCS